MEEGGRGACRFKSGSIVVNLNRAVSNRAFVKFCYVAIPTLIALLAQIALFKVVGSLVIGWLFGSDANWYEGPLGGGIFLVPVFFLILPVSVWIAWRIWRPAKQRITKWHSDAGQT